jgi:hypothetical protein
MQGSYNDNSPPKNTTIGEMNVYVPICIVPVYF